MADVSKIQDSRVVSKMTKTKNVPTECLLNNIIDVDVQATLLPLNILQTLFLAAKFDVINNFITPKNNFSHLLASVIGAAVLIFCSILRFYFYYYAIQDLKSPILAFVMYFDVVFNSTISIALHVVTSWQSVNTVELIIRLQKILNSIKIDKKHFLFKIKVQNWISIMILVTVYVLYLFVPKVVVGSGPVLYVFINIATVTPVLIFDLQIVIVTRVVVYIRKELEAWNNAMAKFKNGNVTRGEVKCDEPSVNDMFDAYTDIVRAFHLCNKVYMFFFTFIGFETFIYILASLQLVIEFGKSNVEEEFFKSTTMKVLTIGWNLKNFILMTLLSIASENFYGTVRTTETTCAQMLSSDQATGMRRTCKNVFRLRRAALRKLSACGVFELDATLPLRLLAALLAYTVVLLQFEFL